MRRLPALAVLLLCGCHHAAVPDGAPAPAPAAVAMEEPSAVRGEPAELAGLPSPADEHDEPLETGAAPVIASEPAIASKPAMTPEPAIALEPVLAATTPDPALGRGIVGALCEEVGGKLGSVSVEDCMAQSLRASGRHSVKGRALALRDFAAAEGGAAPSRVLVLGGLHGDEYSSISIMFKWMALLTAEPANEFAWRFLPVVNPDGLLQSPAVRQNANGVDLNRNFPSRDWSRLALKEWREKTGANPRRFPGAGPASEPEVQWVVEQILEFRPDVIVSVHAPYDLLDYDGPARAPERIGELYLRQLGVFPGSLGNYAGVDLGMPVVTLELPSAGIMPSAAQIGAMWNDLVHWLRKRRGGES